MGSFWNPPASRSGSPKKKRKSLPCFSCMAELLGIFLKASERVHCWGNSIPALGLARLGICSWAPFGRHLTRPSLGSDFVQAGGCDGDPVLQIVGLPRGFAFQELCCCRACPNRAELPDRDAGEASANLHLNLQMIEVSSVSGGMKKSMLSGVPPVPT